MATEHEIDARPHSTRCPSCGSGVELLRTTERADGLVVAAREQLACSSTSCTWSSALD